MEIAHEKSRLPQRQRQLVLDPANAKRYTQAFAKFKVQCELVFTAYWPYWRLYDPKSDMVMTPMYDVDIDRILKALDAGHPFETIDYTITTQPKLAHAPGTPLCVVCGQPGGLPCPKVVQRAHRNHIKLAVTTGVQLHPGRCLKKLKELNTIIESKRP